MRQKKNQSDQAVALHYDHNPGSAPRVVASGQGALARKILAAARQVGVDIVEDADLLEVLGKVPVGQEIPAELFTAVAEILAFIYQANNQFATRQNA